MAKLRDSINNLDQTVAKIDLGIIKGKDVNVTQQQLSSAKVAIDKVIKSLGGSVPEEVNVEERNVIHVEKRNGKIRINLPWTIVFTKNNKIESHKTEWYWENELVKIVTYVFKDREQGELDVSRYPKIDPTKKVAIRISNLKFIEQSNEVIVPIPSHLKYGENITEAGILFSTDRLDYFIYDDHIEIKGIYEESREEGNRRGTNR